MVGDKMHRLDAGIGQQNCSNHVERCGKFGGAIQFLFRRWFRHLRDVPLADAPSGGVPVEKVPVDDAPVQGSVTSWVSPRLLRRTQTERGRCPAVLSSRYRQIIL